MTDDYEEFPTPIEDDTVEDVQNLARESLKDKRYQFGNVIRGWRSKYQRHAGEKQCRKHFAKLIKMFPHLSNQDLAAEVEFAKQVSNQRESWLEYVAAMLAEVESRKSVESAIVAYEERDFSHTLPPT